MLALKPDSRFAIESYEYQAGDEDGKAVYNLLKGGMQTITGAIGRKNKENYALKTPTATIGIRGTYYQLKACQGDCFNPAGEPQPDGLYGGVKGGAIKITNQSGSYTINVGQYFYMADPQAPVVMLDKPPAILGAMEGSAEGKKKPDGRPAEPARPPTSNGDGPMPSGGGDTLPPPPSAETSQAPTPEPSADNLQAPTPVVDSLNPAELPAPPGVDPTPTGDDPVAGGGTAGESTLQINLEPIGVAVAQGGGFGVVFSAENANGAMKQTMDLITLDASRRAYFDEATPALSFLTIDGAACTLCQLESGSSSFVDSGRYEVVGTRWGRWQGDYTVIENGQPLTPTSAGLHYIYSSDLTNKSTVDSFSGRATFDFFGGTSPTDDAGHVGVVNASQSYLLVDFDTQVFDSASLGFSLNSRDYLVGSSDATPLGSLLKTGLTLTGDGLSGDLLTQFVGTGGQGVSGVYSLTDGVKTINGTGLFLRADRLSVTPTGSLTPAGGVLATAYSRVGSTGISGSFVDVLVLNNSQDVFLNSASAPTYIESTNNTGCQVCQFISVDAVLADSGGNSSLGVTWGRWTGDYVVAHDGFELSELSDNYHFIYSNQLASTAAVENTVGFAVFDYVGGTKPTDQFGNEGVVDASASYVDFDFYAQTFTSVSYRFDLAGNVYQLNNSAPVGLSDAVGAEIPLQGGDLSGYFSAQLLGFNGTGISGVYTLSGSGLDVFATGLFQRANRLDIVPEGTPLTAGGLGIVASVKGRDQAVDHVNDQFTVDADHSIYVNSASAPTYIEKTGDSSCVSCQFEAGEASYQDIGSNAATGSYWGRWEGGFTVAENGLVLDPLGDQLHYIGNAQVTSYSVIQGQTGVASFDYVGGTSPTDEQGNLGSVVAAQTNLKVDFNAQVFSEVNLGLMLGGTGYQLSNDIKVAIDADLSSKIPISGSGLTGDFSAQFVGSNAEGVNASYHAGSGQTSITGVATFDRRAVVVEPPRVPDIPDDGCGGCEGGEMEFPQ